MVKSGLAAALILVVWYLIMPPVYPGEQLGDDAPFSQWQTINTFQTAAGCRDELAKLTVLIAGNVSHSLIQRRVLAAQCVAADDPRLKAN